MEGSQIFPAVKSDLILERAIAAHRRPLKFDTSLPAIALPEEQSRLPSQKPHITN
jgi:hypothetical protein